MVQGGWDSAYLYDMSPRKNGGVFFNQPQQLDFGTKIGSDGNERHFRFLGERKAGRLWMFVNGHLVGSLGKRTAGSPGDNPKGKGISIIPQPMLSRVTVSNLWIAPWTGILPEGVRDKTKESSAEDAAKPAPAAPGLPQEAPAGTVAKAGEAAAKPKTETPADAVQIPVSTLDTVALTNGDETTGKVLKATADTLTIQCDVGELEIPLQRASLVDFASKPVTQRGGIRLRFVGRGALTVDSLRLEGGKVFCESASTGALSFALSDVAEIIYQPSSVVAPQAAAGTDSAKVEPPTGKAQ
jgi:hypothetical protein